MKIILSVFMFVSLSSFARGSSFVKIKEWKETEVVKKVFEKRVYQTDIACVVYNYPDAEAFLYYKDYSSIEAVEKLANTKFYLSNPCTSNSYNELVVMGLRPILVDLNTSLKDIKSIVERQKNFVKYELLFVRTTVEKLNN